MSPHTRFLTNSLIPILLGITTVLYISLNVLSVNSLRISSPKRHPPQPEIWLSEYLEVDAIDGTPAKKEFQTLAQFQNEFISKNGTDYVLHDELYFLVFICQAQYPITWELPHLMQVPGGKISNVIYSGEQRISEFPPEAVHPVNKYFKSYLALLTRNNEFFSVSFNCKAVDSKEALAITSIHLYYEGNEVLENEGKNISVSVLKNHDHSLDENPLTLPCRPAVPTIPVTLEKESTDGSWKRVSSRWLTFNPKLGFSLQKLHRGKEGSYRCRVNGTAVGRDSDAFLFINVTSAVLEQNNNIKTKFEPHRELEGKAKVQRNGSSLNEVICCSGEPGKKPDVHVNYCHDRFQCELLKLMSTELEFNKQISFQTLTKEKDCNKVDIFQSPTLVQCQETNIDFAEEFIEILRLGVTDLAKRKQYRNTSKSEFDRSLSYFTEGAQARDSSVEETILISVGYNASMKEITRAHHHHHQIPSVFRNQDLSKSVFRSRAQMDYERIAEYPRNYYYEGEPLLLMCFGLKYFYTADGYLRLNWKNGSKSILTNRLLENTRVVYLSDGASLGTLASGINFRSVFATDLKADSEMESVDCFMPVWNSVGWEKLTYNINTKTPIPSKFSGEEEEEIVYFYLNDTDKEISWKVLEGKPLPKLRLTKDGKKLAKISYNITWDDHDQKEEGIDSEEANYGNRTAIITIKFKSITHEIQGNYECSAENGKEKVTKVIKIIVTGKQNVVPVVLSISCVTVLLVILLGIGIKFRLQLGQMWKLRRLKL